MTGDFRLPEKNAAKIKRETAVTAIFVLFFAMPCWEWIFTQLFELAGHPEYAPSVTLVFVYLPIALLFAYSRRHIPADFVILWLCAAAFFCVTYLFHPEYKYVYMRNPYGVLDYVFRPDNGLYAYLFVRLVNDPVRILRGLKISGYLVYAYSALRLYIAASRGYWIEEGSRGQEITSPYNLNFGYSLLIFVCCYLYCAFEYRSVFSFLLACAGGFMILCGGSRGPLLDIAIFVFLYVLIRFVNTSRKWLFLLVGFYAAAMLFVLYRPFVDWLYGLFEKYDITSRTLEMMFEGSAAESNGRDTLWLAAFHMIKENPFGYGAMGARHVLYQIHIVGHPHNFFIEILIEYGVVAGSIMIALLLFLSFRQFLRKGRSQWQGVFLIFFAQACQLLTSYTYWHSGSLWGALAVGVCIYYAGRNGHAGKQDLECA